LSLSILKISFIKLKFKTMKKIHLILLILSSITFQAQVLDDNSFFKNLYAKSTYGYPSEQQHYHIESITEAIGGPPVLDIKWWGGLKMRTDLGLLKIQQAGNVGINTENPISKLDVRGDFRVESNGNIFAYTGGADLVLKAPSRGNNGYGRALVHDTSNILALNYDNDFTGGTRIGTSFFVKGENASLQGKLEAKEIKVTLTPTADFVFAEDYDLPKLEDVEKHIKEKKHLPEIASAKQMEKEGVNVGEFQIKLLQKIEELTLYTIEQNKRLNKQANEIEELKNQLKTKK